MTDTTANLGLTKPVVEGSDGDWGDLLNADLDLIDAFAAKVPILLANGTLGGAGVIDLSLSSSFTAFRVEIADLSTPGTALFVRFSMDGSTYLTSGYDWVRSDLSAKSSGTQTFASGVADAALHLSDVLNGQGVNTDTGGYFTIDINNKSTGSHGRIDLKAGGTYFNNDGGGYRTRSDASGALMGQTTRALAVQFGGFIPPSDYGSGIRCSYALFGLPGLA